MVLLSWLCSCVVFFSTDDEVKIEPTGKVLYLKEGQAQMLKCSATVTDEKKKLKWVHPSSEGVKSVEQINRSGGNISLDITLQITDFAVVNSGEYKCQLLKEDSMEKEKTISLLTVKGNVSLSILHSMFTLFFLFHYPMFLTMIFFFLGAQAL